MKQGIYTADFTTRRDLLLLFGRLSPCPPLFSALLPIFVNYPSFYIFYSYEGIGLVTQTRRDSRVRALAAALSSNNLAQVVHTHAPLSPSSITWYRPQLGRKLTHHTMH